MLIVGIDFLVGCYSKLTLTWLLTEYTKFIRLNVAYTEANHDQMMKNNWVRGARENKFVERYKCAACA